MSEPATASSPNKLPAWFIALGVAGFVLYVLNYQNAFPSASLAFKIPRLKIQSMAADLGARLGYKAESKIKSTIFGRDYSALLFLQHNYGPKEADRLIQSGLPCFYWNSRFCSPGQLEEFSSSRTPAGKLTYLAHNIPNDLPLPSLDQEQGKKLIDDFLLQEAQLDPAKYKLLSFKSEKRKARTDLSYTFEESQKDYKGARLRLDFVVSGNELTHFRSYLFTPDSWDLKYRSMFSYNQVLNAVFWFLHYIMLGGAFLYLLNLLVRRELKWSFALRAAALISSFSALALLVNIPTLLHDYSTENPELSFYLTLLMAIIGRSSVSFLTNVALFAPAEAIYRKLYGKGIVLNDLFQKKGIASANFRNAVLLGLAACGIWQGWQNIYYWLGSYAGISSPLGMDHPDVYGSYIPCFDLLYIGTEASFTEELAYRVIFLLVAQRLTKKFWLANFLQAFIWSLGHTTYPMSPVWARVAELTCSGLIAGAVFRSFGVLPFIVAHYLFDAFVLNLFKANDWQLVLSATLAILPPFALYLLSRFCSEASSSSVAKNAPVVDAPVDASTGGTTAAAFATDTASANAAPVDAASADTSSADAASADATSADAASADATPDAISRKTGAWRIPAIASFAAAFVGIALCMAAMFLSKPDPLSLRVSQSAAMQMARDYIKKNGLDDPSLKLSFEKLSADISDSSSQCIQDKLGKQKFLQIFNDTFSPEVWTVRLCGEERIKELDVQIDACRNRVMGLVCKVPDDESGARLSKDVALGKIETFLREFHSDLLPFKLVGCKTFQRPNRTDYTTQWECARFGPSDAKLRLECSTVGDVVSGFSTYFDLPDKWSFKYREFTARRGAACFAVIITLLLLITGVIVWLLKVPKNNAPSFSWIGAFLVIVAAVKFVMDLLHVPCLLATYDSQTPFLASMIRKFLIQGTEYIPLLCCFGITLILASDAGQQFTPLDRDRKQGAKRIPIVPPESSPIQSLCNGYTLGAFALLLLNGAISLVSNYSHEVVVNAYDILAYNAQGYSPCLFVIASALLFAIMSIPILGMIYGFCQRYLASHWRFFAASLLVSFSIAGLTRQSHDCLLIAGLTMLGIYSARIAIYRFFRADPFSCACAVYAFVILGLSSQFVMLARPLLANDAYICLGALLLPLLLSFLISRANKVNRVV